MNHTYIAKTQRHVSDGSLRSPGGRAFISLSGGTAGLRRAGAANWGSWSGAPGVARRCRPAVTHCRCAVANRRAPPHPPDIKPTILCGSNLIPCRASRDMDLDVQNVH
ncbi:unnamed protein product, partial [Brenthis ino]